MWSNYRFSIISTTMCFRLRIAGSVLSNMRRSFLTFNRGRVVSGLELSDVYQIGKKENTIHVYKPAADPCLACAIMQN